MKSAVSIIWQSNESVWFEYFKVYLSVCISLNILQEVRNLCCFIIVGSTAPGGLWPS